VGDRGIKIGRKYRNIRIENEGDCCGWAFRKD
jgi:hypothetical protein